MGVALGAPPSALRSTTKDGEGGGPGTMAVSPRWAMGGSPVQVGACHMHAACLSYACNMNPPFLSALCVTKAVVGQEVLNQHTHTAR